MKYGFIYHNGNGLLTIHVLGYSYHDFIGYSEKEAIAKYRQLFGLKYKKIRFM